MPIIIPTITTDSPDIYATQIEAYSEFAPRIHIDITDGMFAPSQTINLNQLYWQRKDREYSIDLHLMIGEPIKWLNQIVSLAPDRAIFHAESVNATAQLPRIFEHLHKFNIECGVALLPETSPESVADIIKLADSVLIFGGHLGYQGGEADLSQLDKVSKIREIKEGIIIEYDGGANLSNIAQIATAGIDQINVGSAISKTDNPQEAYEQLLARTH